MSEPQPPDARTDDPSPRRDYVKPRLQVVPMENALASRTDLSPFYATS